MLPGVFEFAWTPDRLVFLGAFFMVLTTIGLVLALVAWKSRQVFLARRVESILWHSDFHDLPSDCRRCRHELAGRVAVRECHNGFDCRRCKDYPSLARRDAAMSGGGGVPMAALDRAIADRAAEETYGLRMPEDRLYHRGHAWVREEPDGTLTIGLDDLGRRLIGKPDRRDLPAPGSQLEVNGTGWSEHRGQRSARILSPIDGTVIATVADEPGADWILRVRPAQQPATLRHLLRGDEVRSWALAEIARVQRALSPAGLGASLADGGVPVDDMPASMPLADWDRIYGELFLEG